MSNVVPFEGNVVPAIFKDMAPDADDLSAGVSGGFAVISFRGSKWRVKYQGEEHPLLGPGGDPIPTLEVVILKGNPHITKNFYKQGYTEGAAESPDCFSMDGIRPDVGAKVRQSETCARCPQNVFGSRMTPAGKKAKACQDNRRLAVVPVADIANEMFGGPMLLRVPAASLTELALMGKNLKARGFPYNSVSVKLGFDMDASYPKLTFKPQRPLNDEEALKVKALLSDEKLDRILAEAIEVVSGKAEASTPAQAPQAAPAPAAPPQDTLFEQPVPQGARPAEAVADRAPPHSPVFTPKPEAPPVNSLEGDTPLDGDIKSILAGLGDLT